MSKTNTGTWKERALELIEKASKGAHPCLTQAQLARSIGVCRQTVWRDREVTDKLLELNMRFSTGGRNVKNRLTQSEEIEVLRERVEGLERENDRLIQNLIVIYKCLDERGLDPEALVGASLAELASATIPWN